ncbi:MAG TPA: hypothetical protein VI542_13430, partial [Candidatus Tectomicrobia bacterium]
KMFIGKLVHIRPISMVTRFRIQRLCGWRRRFTVRTMARSAAGLIEFPSDFGIACTYGVLHSPQNESQPYKTTCNRTLTPIAHSTPPVARP